MFDGARQRDRYGVCIKLLKRELQERRIAESYRTAYEATPLTADELVVLDAASALVGDAMP
jgi:hypothetical protein